MSRVPIIVLTADRPPELQGVGANQTIDQQQLFGKFVKWFCDSGLPGRWIARRVPPLGVARSARDRSRRSATRPVRCI